MNELGKTDYTYFYVGTICDNDILFDIYQNELGETVYVAIEHLY